HLRQVLSRAKDRSGACRHRSRARHLARFCRGHAWHHRRCQPHRPHWRRLHHRPAYPARTADVGRRRMSAAPVRVLVVDDEPPIRKLLRMGLTAQGYQIVEAANGKTALDLLSQSPDLIILDLGLPDTQGLDLLQTIRARNESVPIVVLSSRG